MTFRTAVLALAVVGWRRRQQLEPSNIAIADERGAPTTVFHRDAAYPAIVAYLAAKPYQDMLAELRRK